MGELHRHCGESLGELKNWDCSVEIILDEMIGVVLTSMTQRRNR